jgi:hypothetical protein
MPAGAAAARAFAFARGGVGVFVAAGGTVGVEVRVAVGAAGDKGVGVFVAVGGGTCAGVHVGAAGGTGVNVNVEVGAAGGGAGLGALAAGGGAGNGAEFFAAGAAPALKKRARRDNNTAQVERFKIELKFFNFLIIVLPKQKQIKSPIQNAACLPVPTAEVSTAEGFTPQVRSCRGF